MSIFTRWLSHQLHHPPVVQDAPPALHFSGFDLASMLDCHSAWLEQLGRDLDDDHDDLPVLPANVARDDICTLGRWLHSDLGERFGHTREYQDLLQHHAEFHRLAGDICHSHNLGLNETARWTLGHELSALSRLVHQDLERFYLHHLV